MDKRLANYGVIVMAFLLASCGGGGGDSFTAGPTPPPPTPPSPGSTVTLSGRISFDRVPFKSTLGTGLDFNNVIDAPARGVVVEAIDSSSGAVLATTSTNATGNYSFTVNANTNLLLRAKAQMVQSGSGATWNFRVLNNTNGNALYVLDGTVFNTGATDVTRNLRATSGWNGLTYATTPGARAAAPFAILDTEYQAKELLLSAQSTLAMPPLDVFWSISNKPNVSSFCPSTGDTQVTGYHRSAGDDCTPPGVAPRGIYVQGDFANGSGDTDEFDQSVVAHEFGHYVEDLFGRSDSIGGNHGTSQRLDMRVAMSEGWGNAFASMVLNDPVYRDSQVGVTADNSFNVEAGSDPNAGWYSEATVQQVIWDVFDPANESSDALVLPFAQIFQAMIGLQKSTFALTDLHTFAAALKSISPNSTSAIDGLLTAPPRNITGSGEFATGETNSAGEPGVLPIYIPLTLNQIQNAVCTSARFGSYNKLANRKFLRFDLSVARTVSITVTGQVDPAQPSSQAAGDPDFVVWRQGVRMAPFDSETPGQEVSGPLQLQSGTYILEVYDYQYANPGSNVTSTIQRCMTVSVTG